MTWVSLRGCLKVIILNPAVAAIKSGYRPVAATACRKSGSHPGGDLRSSWKVLAANAEQGMVGAELPDLGSWSNSIEHETSCRDVDEGFRSLRCPFGGTA